MFAERVLLKERISELEREVASLCERILACDPDAAERTRASIVAFLTSEARRFDAESKEASRDRGNASERLRAQASLLRTLAAQIARGDDRLGGGQ